MPATKTAKRNFHLLLTGRVISDDALDYGEGYSNVVDAVSTLKAAGYGFILEHRACEDEQDMSWGLERFEDRKVARS